MHEFRCGLVCVAMSALRSADGASEELSDAESVMTEVIEAELNDGNNDNDIEDIDGIDGADVPIDESSLLNVVESIVDDETSQEPPSSGSNGYEPNAGDPAWVADTGAGAVISSVEFMGTVNAEAMNRNATNAERNVLSLSLIHISEPTRPY